MSNRQRRKLHWVVVAREGERRAGGEREAIWDFARDTTATKVLRRERGREEVVMERIPS
jgi:hypothetical protein